MTRAALALLTVPLVALAACGDPTPAPPRAPEGSPSAAIPLDTTGTPPVADSLTAEEAVGIALKVGDTAPDFALPDASGRTVRLSDLLASGPVVLAFYRGSWCPYCNTELRGLQQALPQVEAARARLVAVSPQTPDSSVSIVERQGLTFPVLSDAGNRVAREFGLVFRVGDDVREQYRTYGIDLERSNGDASWELPVPATYVVAPDRTITYAFVEADYTRRAAPADIVAALREAGASGT
ncbi:MAG TPA: peroxiredoxin-like family protein [Rubricoccaceae bacterium]|jgi:peroxiredoxin